MFSSLNKVISATVSKAVSALCFTLFTVPIAIPIVLTPISLQPEFIADFHKKVAATAAKDHASTVDTGVIDDVSADPTEPKTAATCSLDASSTIGSGSFDYSELASSAHVDDEASIKTSTSDSMLSECFVDVDLFEDFETMELDCIKDENNKAGSHGALTTIKTGAIVCHGEEKVVSIAGEEQTKIVAVEIESSIEEFRSKVEGLETLQASSPVPEYFEFASSILGLEESYLDFEERVELSLARLSSLEEESKALMKEMDNELYDVFEAIKHFHSARVENFEVIAPEPLTVIEAAEIDINPRPSAVDLVVEEDGSDASELGSDFTNQSDNESSSESSASSSVPSSPSSATSSFFDDPSWFDSPSPSFDWSESLDDDDLPLPTFSTPTSPTCCVGLGISYPPSSPGTSITSVTPSPPAIPLPSKANTPSDSVMAKKFGKRDFKKPIEKSTVSDFDRKMAEIMAAIGQGGSGCVAPALPFSAPKRDEKPHRSLFGTAVKEIRNA